MKHTVYIGVGSNLGDKKANCLSAVERFREHPHIKLEAVSQWYETEALTATEEKQPTYINGVVKVVTDLTPMEVLESLKEVEHALGRPENHSRWSARVIDLDILFFDDLIHHDEKLSIPHREIEKRMFVLKPLCDIDATLIHPVFNKTVQELYDTFTIHRTV